MLQIGIVGLGGIGNNHARCYTANKYSKVVAVCDVIKEKADAAAEQYGAQAFYSVKQMLKSGIKLDGCSVTTAGVENGSDHYNPTMELLQAGIPVLGEKPISNDVAKAGALRNQFEPPFYAGGGQGQRVVAGRALGRA
jgi:predicted dehydrogenase